MQLKWTGEITIREIYLANEKGEKFKIKLYTSPNNKAPTATEYFQMQFDNWWPLYNDQQHGEKIDALAAYQLESDSFA